MQKMGHPVTFAWDSSPNPLLLHQIKEEKILGGAGIYVSLSHSSVELHDESHLHAEGECICPSHLNILFTMPGV